LCANKTTKPCYLNTVNLLLRSITY
jgi:hypothetical protein